MTQGPAFLVGAGFSAPFGIPTMQPFLADFVAFEKRSHPQLSDSLNQFMQRLGTGPDLEGLLSQLNAAAALPDGLPPGHEDPKLSSWVATARAIRSHLSSYIVERCEQFDRVLAMELALPFVETAASLRGSLFTTNYDRVLEHCAAERSIAVSDGFASVAGEAVSPWNGDFTSGLPLAKLHGSVTWYTDPSGPKHLRLDRGYPLPGPEFHLARGTSLLEPLMVVPTLEKATLQAPYNHLTTLLADVLSSASALVVIGSSLRDTHIVGAVDYHMHRLPVLVVSRHAHSVSGRLSAEGAVALSLSTEHFLRHSLRPLAAMLSDLGTPDDYESRYSSLVEFAAREAKAAAQQQTLSATERDALEALEVGSELVKIRALENLRTSGHAAVAAAVRQALSDGSPRVRTAAAGTLGLMGSPGAVSELSLQAIADSDPGARLEAALALKAIGSTEAEDALTRRAQERPDDDFVRVALADTGD